MHISPFPKSKGFSKGFIVYAAFTTLLVGVGAAVALAAGITPASAQSLAQNSKTQIAVFMVPLTLLMVAVLFEVARITLRGALPAEPAPRQPTRLSWKPGMGEG